MALKIGRLGYLGIGIESTPGTAVAATTTLPFVNTKLEGKHNPITDIAARASRAKNFNSVIGKQWGEGEIDFNVDTLQVGYLLKCALGNEVVNTVATGVYDHLFYTTISGNQPTTATLYNYQGVDTQQYAGMAVDKLDLEVKDALMVAKVGWKGNFPTSGSYAPVTTSGTLVPFAKYSLKLGNNLVTAASSSAVPVTEFTLSIKNNAESVFESGSSTTTRTFWQELTVDGTFTRYFETVTDRDNYYNLNKQSLILTASGMALPNGYTEQMVINLAKVVYTDTAIDTGIEKFYAIKTNFTAEVDPAQGKQLDIVLRNYKSAVYS